MAETKRTAVEFYTIELTHLADGALYLQITATTVDEEGPQFLCQEITSERVVAIDDALAIIKESVISTSSYSDQAL